MVMPYVSPAQMEYSRLTIVRFAKGALSLECIRSHFYPDHSGKCDLSSKGEQEEIFVLANRSGATLKVSRQSMQIVANIVDISGADQWYEHLKEQRKLDKDRQKLDQERLEERRSAPRAVLFRRKPTELLGKN